MPVDKTTAKNLVRQAANDEEEKKNWLRLVETMPILWEGLEEDELVAVSRLHMETHVWQRLGKMKDHAHTTNACMVSVEKQLSLGAYVHSSGTYS